MMGRFCSRQWLACGTPSPCPDRMRSRGDRLADALRSWDRASVDGIWPQTAAMSSHRLHRCAFHRARNPRQRPAPAHWQRGSRRFREHAELDSRRAHPDGNPSAPSVRLTRAPDGAELGKPRATGEAGDYSVNVGPAFAVTYKHQPCALRALVAAHARLRATRCLLTWSCEMAPHTTSEE